MISGKKHRRTRIGDGGVVDPTTITSDSTPNYDTGFVGNNGWDCTDWMSFHKALVATYGQADANAKWQSAWDAQAWNARPYNWCEYESGFYDYFKSQGINVGDLTAAVLVPASEAVSTVATDASNVVSNTANAASSLSGWLLPLTVLALGVGGVFLYQDFVKPAARAANS